MELTFDHDHIRDYDYTREVAGEGLLARLGRQKTWLVVGSVLTLTATCVLYSALSVTYRASAAIMVASNEVALASSNSGAEAQRLGDPADIESQMLMLRSPRLAHIILDDPKVADALIADCKASRMGTWFNRLVARAIPPAPCKSGQEGFQDELQRLQAGFSIGPTGRSRVIEVSFVSALPETAVIVANALVEAYLNDDKERKVDTHDNAINWLTAEIARGGVELRKAELEVEAYRSEHGIVRGQQASIASERLSALGQQLAMAQAAYAQALSRAGGGSDANLQEVLGNRTIGDLKQQSAQLAASFAELRQRLGDNHPAVLAARNQRSEVDRRLDSETFRVRVSLQREVQAASQRVAELREQYEKLMRDVGETGGAEAGIAIMVRDVEARREIYVEQLKKLNVLQTERRLLSGDARLVNHAEIPDRPWFPKKLPFVGVGAVLAAVVGAGLGLFRDRKDRTLRVTSGLPQLAGVPILGYLPWVRQRRGNQSPVMQLRNSSPLQESVRALFSRFVLVPGIAPKTIMAGSADIGEGKTFLTLAIALFAETTGRRVLVIEADLRRPTFQKTLNLKTDVGLSEFLRGEATISDIVQLHHGLHVIAAGTPSIDSTELLSTSRLDRLLDAAATNYDLILLDSPPSMLLMDAQVLARRVDGILYCASFGRSRLDRVLRGMRELAAAGGNMLGIVVCGGRGNDSPNYYLPAPRIS
jgi:succinoglycan biosynthesis transport protein ExoP